MTASVIGVPGVPTGKFDVKLYQGGLPGAGWDLSQPVTGKAERSKDQRRADLEQAHADGGGTGSF